MLALMDRSFVEAGGFLKGLTKNPLGGLMGGAMGGAEGGATRPPEYCCQQVMQFAPPPPWMSSPYPSVPEKSRKAKKKGGVGSSLLEGLGLEGLV